MARTATAICQHKKNTEIGMLESDTSVMLGSAKGDVPEQTSTQD